MMRTVSIIQEMILRSLAEFRFLTLTQLLHVIEECKTYKTLWYHIDQLVKPRRPPLKKISFNTISRIGRVEDVYYLTSYGLELIQQYVSDKENVFLASNPQLSSDYFHRKCTIDFHINLAKQKLLNVEYFDPYFITKKSSKGFTSLNKLKIPQTRKSIIPDAAFQLGYEVTNRFFYLEWHNGKDIRRILSQLHHHALAMTSGVVHAKYDIPLNKAYYVLIVFELQESLIKFLMEVEKSKGVYQKIAKFFGVKTMEDVGEDFTKNWVDILGNELIINI